MNRICFAVIAALALATPTFATSATVVTAQVEGKMIGTVAAIYLQATSALVTLKDSSGQNVVIFIDDEVTLAKLRDKRISIGDEIKCKYEPKDGKNHATYFKKAGGC